MSICKYLTEVVMDIHPLHIDKWWADSLIKARKYSVIISNMHTTKWSKYNSQEIIFALPLEKYLSRIWLNLPLQAKKFRLSWRRKTASSDKMTTGICKVRWQQHRAHLPWLPWQGILKEPEAFYSYSGQLFVSANISKDSAPIAIP